MIQRIGEMATGNLLEQTVMPLGGIVIDRQSFGSRRRGARQDDVGMQMFLRRFAFPKGAQMKDPKKLFNTRLDSKTVRAIDFHQGDPVAEAALQALVLEAVRLNTSKMPKR